MGADVGEAGWDEEPEDEEELVEHRLIIQD